jgi:hypothetical protein
MSKWLTLIQTSPSEVSSLRDALDDCGGSAENMSNALMSGTGGTIEQLKSTFDVLTVTIGQAVAPAFQSLMEKIIDVMNAIMDMDPATQKMILTITAIVAAIGPVLIVVGKMATGVGALMTLAPKIVSAINLLKAGMTGSERCNGGKSYRSHHHSNWTARRGVYLPVEQLRELPQFLDQPLGQHQGSRGNRLDGDQGLLRDNLERDFQRIHLRGERHQQLSVRRVERNPKRGHNGDERHQHCDPDGVEWHQDILHHDFHGDTDCGHDIFQYLQDGHYNGSHGNPDRGHHCMERDKDGDLDSLHCHPDCRHNRLECHQNRDYDCDATASRPPSRPRGTE